MGGKGKVMEVFSKASEMGHEQIVFNHDHATGLKAIIAIHDTTLGPSLGGCRFWNYASEEEALLDVLRLARGMTYKAAVAGLNLGGGKAVIMGDPKKLKSEALFRAFGRFVNSLGGRYITAEDVNVNPHDVDYVAMETKYVTGIASGGGGSGDPSPITALGVFSGIKASVQYKLKRESLTGLKVAIQGVGAVGYHLCTLLKAAGAELVVSDIEQARVERVVSQLGAIPLDTAEIHAADADVFAPCALGAILNDESIPQIKAAIIAGAANNQLQDEPHHGQMLRERDICYAPDYVINAGGLINVYHELRGYNEKAARRQASKIFDTLLEIYEEADRAGTTTNNASDLVAEKRLDAVRKMADLRNTYNNQSWLMR
jgi:leucine dehydrogenase